MVVAEGAALVVSLWVAKKVAVLAGPQRFYHHVFWGAGFLGKPSRRRNDETTRMQDARFVE
jgi:hypothetical protein